MGISVPQVVISAEHLRKTYGTQVVLKDVSLTIRSGEFVVLLGASGSGKSTLLRALNGLLLMDAHPGFVGRVSCLGRPVQCGGRSSAGLLRLRSQIGFIFQQFQLVRRLPVLTNVLVGLVGQLPAWRAHLRWFNTAERQRAWRALQRVGLGQLAWRRAAELSGGQQQRVAIARALAQGAQVILADEPIASLDPASAARVMDTLADLNRREGVTVVVSLHQVEAACRYATRIVALSRGEVCYDGPVEELSPRVLEQIYQEVGVSPAA